MCNLRTKLNRINCHCGKAQQINVTLFMGIEVMGQQIALPLLACTRIQLSEVT